MGPSPLPSPRQVAPSPPKPASSPPSSPRPPRADARPELKGAPPLLPRPPPLPPIPPLPDPAPSQPKFSRPGSPTRFLNPDPTDQPSRRSDHGTGPSSPHTTRGQAAPLSARLFSAILPGKKDRGRGDQRADADIELHSLPARPAPRTDRNSHSGPDDAARGRPVLPVAFPAYRAQQLAPTAARRRKRARSLPAPLPSMDRSRRNRIRPGDRSPVRPDQDGHTALDRARTRSYYTLRGAARAQALADTDGDTASSVCSSRDLRRSKSSSVLPSWGYSWGGGLHSTVGIGIGEAVTLPIKSHLDADERAKLTDPEQGSDGSSPSVSETSLLLPPSNDEDGHPADPAGQPDQTARAMVKASVSTTDDHTLSINTPRMWFLSLLFAFLGSATNLFFSLRYPSVSITPMIALLLAHPLGILWDRLLKRSDDPITHFEDGVLVKTEAPARAHRAHRPPDPLRRRLRLWLAQGQWNSKEHCCVFTSSNVSFGFAFATDVIVEQTMFYKQDFGVVYQVLLVLSTQILGYSLAGLTRHILVHPTGMIWPQAVNHASMFSTLHKSDNEPANGWTISKYRFFIYVFLGSFIFYFLPGFLFPALSYFNFVTWFAPKNVVLSNLFGVVSGLGLFPLTFDWAQVAYIGSPLIIPLWAVANVIAGIGIAIWILAPVMYYSNVLFSAYLPIMSASVFDNGGKVYDVSRILTADFRFDADGYKSYSRVFLPIAYVLSYFGQFAGLAALVTDTVCWNGREIWGQLKSSVAGSGRDKSYDRLDQDDDDDQHISRPSSPATAPSRRSTGSSRPGLLSGVDIHNALMSRYDEVPMWWYIGSGLLMAAIGIFVVEYYPIFLPWHGLLLSLLICTALFIPIAIVQAVANQHISIYLLCQLVSGVLFPGKPVANMVFTTYGYITSTQGIKFTSDLKLGHYMKVPPRILFSVQLVATVASSLTQLGVLNWMLRNIPGICTTEALNGFTCPLARVHFNGSILWGVVGPGRFFGSDGLYRNLLWAFPVGAALPVLAYVCHRRTKRKVFRKASFPIMLSALSWTPPATGLNFSVWALVCWLFNGVVKSAAFEWWQKYNMTLSAALDSGLATGVSVIFFGIIYPGFLKDFSWWGTEVYKQGCDWQACSFKPVPEGGRFGPD